MNKKFFQEYCMLAVKEMYAHDVLPATPTVLEETDRTLLRHACSAPRTIFITNWENSLGEGFFCIQMNHAFLLPCFGNLLGISSSSAHYSYTPNTTEIFSGEKLPVFNTSLSISVNGSHSVLLEESCYTPRENSLLKTPQNCTCTQLTTLPSVNINPTLLKDAEDCLGELINMLSGSIRAKHAQAFPDNPIQGSTPLKITQFPEYTLLLRVNMETCYFHCAFYWKNRS